MVGLDTKLQLLVYKDKHFARIVVIRRPIDRPSLQASGVF